MAGTGKKDPKNRAVMWWINKLHGRRFLMALSEIARIQAQIKRERLGAQPGPIVDRPH